MGNNSNYCYSMEENNININQNDRIHYSDNDAPDIDEMIKCANYEPIDIDSQNSMYKKFIDFCEEKDIPGIKKLVYNFLEKSYNISNHIIVNPASYLNDYSFKGEIKRWNLQKEASDNPTLYSSGKYTEAYLLDKWQLENNEIFLPEFQVAMYQTTHIMNELHKKLNSSKQTVSIEVVEDNHIKNLFYYFANHLVELSHDILYAISTKIDKYRTNQEVYSFDNSRKYIEHEVIIPSYNAIAKFYYQVFVPYVNINNIILKKNSGISNSLNCGTFREINEVFYQFELYGLEKYVRYGTKLCQKKYEKLKIIAKKLDDIIEKFESTSSHIIKAHIGELKEIKSNYLNSIMCCEIEIGNINNLTNNQIIRKVNNSIKEYTFLYVKDKDKTIKNKFKGSESYYDESYILKHYFYSLGKNYYSKLPETDLEKLFNYEQKKFSKEIQEFNTEIHKLDNKLKDMDYNMIDSNYDYLSEIKESLGKYTKQVEYSNNQF